MVKRNVNKQSPDFRLMYSNDNPPTKLGENNEVIIMERKEWELLHREYMLANFMYFEFKDDKLMRRVLKTTSLTGMFVSPESIEIKLKPGSGQSKYASVVSSSIMKSWKAHNAGSGQKAKAMQSKAKVEAWNVYVKTQCV